MLGEPLVKWCYIREGDFLEYRDHYNNAKKIGPVLEVLDREDLFNFPIPLRKLIIVNSLKVKEVKVSVPLARVQAVFRGAVEMIRFQENELQAQGCVECWQRSVDRSIAGNIFCSIHCQQTWIEQYYDNKNDNPITRGENIHTANC